MTIQTAYTNVRARLATLIDEVTENREIVIIQRCGSERGGKPSFSQNSGRTYGIGQGPTGERPFGCSG